MPNNYMSVLYKHIIQVKNKNVGLKVGGINILLPPPPQARFLRQCIYVTGNLYNQLICILPDFFS